MKNSGMIRKIDNLGRIVIPKEIRKSLNIKEMDDLEIFIENDSLLLKKYSYINNFKDDSLKYASIFNYFTDGKIYISDKDVILSKGILENKKIPKELIKLAQNTKEEKIDNQEYYFDDILVKGNFYICPIIRDSFTEGLIILHKKNIINEEDELVIRILKKLLENI